jgi:hypothetical protein
MLSEFIPTKLIYRYDKEQYQRRVKKMLRILFEDKNSNRVIEKITGSGVK